MTPKESSALHKIYEAVKLQDPSQGQGTRAAETGDEAQASEDRAIQERSEGTGPGSQAEARVASQPGEAPWEYLCPSLRCLSIDLETMTPSPPAKRRCEACC